MFPRKWKFPRKNHRIPHVTRLTRRWVCVSQRFPTNFRKKGPTSLKTVAWGSFPEGRAWTLNARPPRERRGAAPAPRPQGQPRPAQPRGTPTADARQLRPGPRNGGGLADETAAGLIQAGDAPACLLEPSLALTCFCTSASLRAMAASRAAADDRPELRPDTGDGRTGDESRRSSPPPVLWARLPVPAQDAGQPSQWGESSPASGEESNPEVLPRPRRDSWPLTGFSLVARLGVV